MDLEGRLVALEARVVSLEARLAALGVVLGWVPPPPKETCIPFEDRPVDDGGA